MDLKDIYNKQINFQESIKDTYNFDKITNLPCDNIKGFSYHIQQLTSEIGEILSADKRWKNIRNNKFDVENKKEEIADCFIVLMNIAIFSNLTGKDLEKAILDKIDRNKDRSL